MKQRGKNNWSPIPVFPALINEVIPTYYTVIIDFVTQNSCAWYVVVRMPRVSYRVTKYKGRRLR